MINKRFGKLVVIEDLGVRYFGQYKKHYIKCKCDCGKIHITDYYSLINGKCKSCGCYKSVSTKNIVRKEFKSLIGQRFGKLKVIKLEKTEPTKQGKNYYFYRCKCDCGNECIVNKIYLKRGQTKSCGCLKGRKICNV